jgi:hypothetical protein
MHKFGVNLILLEIPPTSRRLESAGFFVVEQGRQDKLRLVKRRRIDDLIQDARNTLTLSPDQVMQVVRTIREFGWHYQKNYLPTPSNNRQGP